MVDNISGEIYETLVVGDVIFQLQSHKYLGGVVLVKHLGDVATYCYIDGFVPHRLNDEAILRWAAENFTPEDMDNLLSPGGTIYRVDAERFIKGPDDL
jgi:hypothetical protein